MALFGGNCTGHEIAVGQLDDLYRNKWQGLTIIAVPHNA
jgi:hypothetical protein